MIELLESALDGLPDGVSPMRARLLNALAVELQWGPEAHRRRELATEALAMARETGDPEALRAALIGGWALIDCTTPFIDTLLELTEEAAAQQWNDPVGNLAVNRNRLAVSAARGERDDMDRYLGVAIELAESLRQPRFVWQARNDEAMVSILSGEIERAETETLTAMQYGQDHGVPDDVVMVSLGALLYMIRWAQGRIGELVPTLEDLVESQPGAPVWRVALAGALSESGRADEAVDQVTWMTVDGCANVPPDIEYPVTLCALARLARTVEMDDATLRHLYEHLKPFAGTFNWTSVSITDSNDHGLGMVAAVLGDHDTSDAHFDAAVDLCERAGARAFLTTVQLDWARMLAARGDDDRAAEVAQRALDRAEELGMTGPHGVAGHARALLAEVGRA